MLVDIYLEIYGDVTKQTSPLHFLPADKHLLIVAVIVYAGAHCPTLNWSVVGIFSRVFDTTTGQLTINNQFWTETVKSLYFQIW